MSSSIYSYNREEELIRDTVYEIVRCSCGKRFEALYKTVINVVSEVYILGRVPRFYGLFNEPSGTIKYRI